MNKTMSSALMRVIKVAKSTKQFPTSDPTFAVMQSFPSGITAEESDPFLMCDHFGPTVSTGKAKHPDEFPVNWHPHRGMDILTYLIKGVGRHADSMGNRGEYRTPGCQWISVGNGIEHAEGGGTPEGEETEGFQIWINVPAARKMDDPRYGVVPPESFPTIQKDGVFGRIIAGTVEGKKGPFETVADVEIVDYDIQGTHEHTHTIPTNLNNCLVYVYKGAGSINGRAVKINDIAHLDAMNNNTRSVTISSTGSFGVLLFAGRKLNQPIAWHGPFVMNNNAEIQETMRDYRNGNFPVKRTPWNYKKIHEFPSSWTGNGGEL